MKKISVKALVIFILTLQLGMPAWADQNPSKGSSSTVLDQYPEVQTALNKSHELLKSNATQSLEYANDALDLSTRNHFDLGIIESERMIGDNYIYQTNYEAGFKHLKTANEKADEVKSNFGKASVMNSLGQFYLIFEKYSQSIDYLNKALNLSKENHYFDLEALATSNLASAYQKSGDINRAEILLKESLKSIRNKNFPGIEAIEAADYLTLGNVAVERKQLNDALNQYNTAYSFYQSKNVNDNRGQLNTLMEIGKTYLEMENAQNAEVCFKEVLERSRKLMYPDIEMNCYEQLAGVFKLSGQFLRSQENYESFVKLKKRLESRSKELVMLQIDGNSKWDAEHKKIEVLQIEKQWTNILITVFAILLSIIVSISIWLAIVSKQRNTVNIQLSKQKEELENLNVVKDRLFSIIGHDLRSPLANLEAILKLMDSGELGLDEVLTLTKRLTNDVQETSIMLENLLHWSNTQMKGIPPKYEDVELLKIARDTITFLKPQSDKKFISLKISNRENCITFADKEMIRLILRNLVANAIKFTPNEGSITIEISKLENEAKVSVIDTGIGIKDENIKKIFSNQPITTRGTENEKGTGLGLMLCRDFVEKNNGRIWVTSELGKGSTFSFTIPLNISDKSPEKREELLESIS